MLLRQAGIIAAAGAATPPLQLLQTGLIAEHRFDNGTGQLISDHSGNGHNVQLGSTPGVDTNDPTWNANGWLTSDGVDDFALIDPGLAIRIGSFSILVRPEFTINGSAVRQCFALGGGQLKVSLDHTNSIFAQTVELRRASDSTFLSAKFGAIVQNEWVVIHGVFDGTNLRAYKNGVLWSTTPVNGDTSTNHQRIAYFCGLSQATPPTQANFAPCSISHGIVRTHAMTDQQIEDEYQYIRFHAVLEGISLPETGDQPGGGGGDPVSHNMVDLLASVGVTHESPALPSNKSWPTTFRTPEQHGAVGNGATDDINAINACLAFAKSNNMGVRFGTNKTYRCNGKISGSATNGWNNMLWEGNGSTLFVDTGASATSGNPFILLQHCNGVRVYNLKVNGNRANRGNDPSSDFFSGHNWQVTSCHDAAWINCEANNAVCDGWRIAGDTTAVSLANLPTWNALVNCVADNCVRLGASVIHGFDIYMVGSGSRYTNANTRAPAAGLDIEPTHHYDSTGTSVNRCIINGPTYSGNRHDGIHIANLGNVTMRNIKIRNCIIENNSGRNLAGSSPSQSHAPIYIGPPVIGGEITGCIIRNNKGTEANSFLRGTGIYFAPGADDATHSWLVNGNQFVGNSGFVNNSSGTGTLSRYCIGSSGAFNGSSTTITNNVEIDIRNTGAGGVNVPNTSPTGNTCRRTSSDGTAFVQNPGGNTTITV